MAHLNKNRLNQRGFTIIELMIASSVFAVVLLICSITMLQVARYFQKGSTINNTQEAARSILDEISGEIRFNGGSYQYVDATATYGGFKTGAICIGTTRFTFAVNAEVSDTGAVGLNNLSRHAIWRDTMISSASCTPYNIATTAAPSDPNTDSTFPGKELVPANMRIMSLTAKPNPLNVSIVPIHLQVMSGDNDVIIGPTGPNPVCQNSILGGQFCASAILDTTVDQRQS